MSVGRDWRCRIFPLTRVYRASNPPLCVVVVVGGLRESNISVTPISQPPQSRPTKRWFRWNGTSRVPYEKMASLDVRRARLEVPNISIDKSISRLQSAVVCGRCGRRIEGEQNIRHTNATTPSITPYEMMASPERGKPGCIRNDGFAGTGQAAFPTK